MNRVFGLDLVRAISIWLVMLQHGGFNIPGLEPLKIGAVGVEIFFVLSGFLIGGIIFRDIDKQLPFWTTLKRFWIRRWYRILPLYYLMILFKFIVIDNSIGWNIIYYLLFLQNNFYGIGFYGVTWSLVIEEWFYLFTPIFLIAVVRLLKSYYAIIIALAVFVLMVNISRVVYVDVTNAPYSGVNGNFPFRFDSLFLGVILSYLKHIEHPMFKRLESPWVFILGLFSLSAYILVYWSWANPVNLINQMWFPRTIGFFLLPFCISLLIPFVDTLSTISTDHWIKKAWFLWVTWTSIYTYAIYLVHTLVFSYLHKIGGALYSKKLTLILGIAISYVLAAGIYRYFERPILNYRDRRVKR